MQLCSHSDFRKLLFGEIQRVIDGGDPILDRFGERREEGSQNGVIGHIHEGHHGVPAFVIIPHLTKDWRGNSTHPNRNIYTPSARKFSS